MRLQTVFKVGLHYLKRSCISLERHEGIRLFGMNAIQHIPELFSETGRRSSSNHTGQIGARPLLDPDRPLPNLELVECLVSCGSERITDILLNRRQHPGQDMLVLNDYSVCCNMMEQQPRIALDEKDLVHLVAQSMEEDHFRKRAAGSPRFQSPLQTSDGEAFIQRVVEGLRHALQRTCNGLPNGRAHDGCNRIHDRLR